MILSMRLTSFTPNRPRATKQDMVRYQASEIFEQPGVTGSSDPINREVATIGRWPNKPAEKPFRPPKQARLALQISLIKLGDVFLWHCPQVQALSVRRTIHI